MLVSMTGFGRAEVALPPDGRAVIEIRTLNHRFLEAEARLPDGLAAYEDSIRTLVADAVRRGRVRVSVAVKASETSSAVTFQTATARRYVTQLRKLKKQLNLTGEIPLETVLALPQVATPSKRDATSARWWPVLKKGVVLALSRTQKMRRQEGKRLEKVLSNLIRALDQNYKEVRRRVPPAQKALEKRMASRIAKAAQSAGVKPNRSAAFSEAAVLVQATDVSEELARIESHLTALKQTVRSGKGTSSKSLAGSAGRTIDFLAQELHREVNTLGSKMRESTIVRTVIAMKGQVEKLREQAANVE